MKTVASLILESAAHGILLYLRDDKPNIPFPHHWDLFGGFVEEGETVEEALVRELQEELGLQLANYMFFRTYDGRDELPHPNTKYVFYSQIERPLSDLTLYEGEQLAYFPREEIPTVRFANILKRIVTDYMESVPRPAV